MNDKSTLQLDAAIIAEMREQFRRGQTVAEICTALKNRLGAKGESLLLILRYFMEAFGLSLRDARHIEGSSLMGNDAFSLEELEAYLRPLMLRSVDSEKQEDSANRSA